MSEFKLLFIALLLWGTSTLANTSSDGGLGQYNAKIDFNVVRLNTEIPDLHVKKRVEPMNIPAAMQILGDLQSLENALKGIETVRPGSLTTLTCSRALCANDGQD